MKLCIVGPANSAHIVKWCKWFSGHGHEVSVISFTPGEIENTRVYSLDVEVDTEGSDLGKLKYMLTGRKIRSLLKEISPDAVSVHYATSYGVAMALSGVKGYALSVWGTDIYDFPKKSPLHKALLEFSLRRPAVLLSTSRAMAEEAANYTKRRFVITPFGVDMELFRPEAAERRTDCFTVGTVKSLSDIYGIRDILKAAAILKKKGEIPLRVRIAGDGPQAEEYKALAKELEIDDITTFLGVISQEQAAVEWASMDVALIPSERESFGVSAVEAQACGTPVIISDAPGLMEATRPVMTSLVTRRNRPEKLAAAIEKLYHDDELRIAMGKRGTVFVRKHYEWNHCFEKIERVFEKL